MINKLQVYCNKYFYYLLFPFIIIHGYFYVQHMTNDYKLMNEYKYIDEITFLNGKEVSNNDYINQHLTLNINETKSFNSTKNIYFLHKEVNDLTFLNMPNYIVLNEYQLKILDKKNYSKFKNIKYSKNLRLLYYDFVSKGLNNENSLYLELNKIENNFSTYPRIQADTIEELEEKMLFIKENTYEQNIQTFDRYYMHENAFMLSPINEMNLGRDNERIFSQYGYLSVKSISKIMDLYGGFSINNYEKAKKTVDLLYYLLAVAFILLFFKNNTLRFAFVLCLGIAFYIHKYYAFSYAPAVTNSRHILDIIILILLYKYGETAKRTYLIISLGLSLLSIYVAKDFGQFLFLSMIGTLAITLIYNYIAKKSFSLVDNIIFILFVIFGFILLKTYPMMVNPSIKYFMDGFYSLPFSQVYMYYLILIIVFMQWLFLLLLYKTLDKYLYSYIFVIFYTQFLYTYFIWHGSTDNIIMFLYLYILPFMIIYNIFNFKYKRYISIFFIFIALIIYGKFYLEFLISKQNYDDVFKTHKLYKWDNERAGGILSTYSFDKFENGINLIKKYNPSNNTFIISKYDNILNILTEKYSSFPFFELRSSIVTQQEFEDIKNQINNEADILFVDNDIERDFQAEMTKLSYFDIDDFWRNESMKQRIPKLENLKRLYQKVKDNYKLLEKGSLISVYKRKEN